MQELGVAQNVLLFAVQDHAPVIASVLNRGHRALPFRPLRTSTHLETLEPDV
jgi:hypothetical protein